MNSFRHPSIYVCILDNIVKLQATTYINLRSTNAAAVRSRHNSEIGTFDIEKYHKYDMTKIVLDRGYINLECFNRDTQNYGLSYEGKRFLSLLSLTRRDNERRSVHDCLNGG